MNASAGTPRRVALAAWCLLAVSIAAWPFVGAAIGRATAAIAFLPLLIPAPVLFRATPRAFRAAPMALAPALALAVTEILVNPPARPWAALSLALAMAAFAAIIATLRVSSRN